MTDADIVQIQNEVFTKIIMDELKRQKAAGTAIGDYVLDKYDIDKRTAAQVKKILSE